MWALLFFKVLWTGESVKIKESKWSTLSDRGMNPSYDVAHLHLFV